MIDHHHNSKADAAVSPFIRVLGEVSVVGPNGVRTISARMDGLVLAHLVVARGRAIPAFMLIDALWGDHPPAMARNALQTKVSRLRRVLNPDHHLTYSQDSYRLAIDTNDSDIGCFRTFAQRAANEIESNPVLARRSADAALDLWRGEPPSYFMNDPVLYCELQELREIWLNLRELHAATHLDRPEELPVAIALFRSILTLAPQRPHAQLGLMRALDRSGRRSEAIAVYDTSRRLSIEHNGLEPPQILREAFEQLLIDEQSALLTPAISAIHRAPPSGLLESARWLADEGDVEGGVQLALRGAWWWWICGQRSYGRDLFEDLLQRSVQAPCVDAHSILGATAWLGVFESQTPHASTSIGRAEVALNDLGCASWTRNEALAASLVAERLFERGSHVRGARILSSASKRFGELDDEWGQAICGTIAARAVLLAGDPDGAMRRAAKWRSVFREHGDAPGQVMALDLLGYIAEVRGDLAGAHEAHREAFDLAVAVHAPDWQASQLTRLGNVETLCGLPTAIGTLERALLISEEAGSHAISALAQNGTGVARSLGGDIDAAMEAHAQSWDWYCATNSLSGLAYTGARLAMLGGPGDNQREQQAIDSLEAAVSTRDPRAVAHSLEAIALISKDPEQSAKAIAASTELRRRALAPLPPIQMTPILKLRERLTSTGSSIIDKSLHFGAKNPNVVVRELLGTEITPQRIADKL